MGVTLLSLGVSSSSPGDFDRAFAKMRKKRPGGLIVFGSASLAKHLKRIFGFAIKNRIPATYTTESGVALGALMSYGADHHQLYRRAASYVDRILKGAKPADLPIEQPTKFNLIINLKTAKKIGVTIPPDLLLQATKVIK
jgi:putative ABC transport system substrate-binding protein